MQTIEALVMATVAVFIGPLILGTAVAHTMAGSALDVKVLEQLKSETVYLRLIGALAGAILWNVVTWFRGRATIQQLSCPNRWTHWSRARVYGEFGSGVL